MGTVVAIETEGGVAIAADRRATSGGTVTGGAVDRVVDRGEVGAGVAGEPGDVDEFRQRLESELSEAEYDREIDVEVLGRIAGRVAENAGVDAAVATYDDEGVPRLRQVGPDGSVLSEAVIALGSGAPTAFGRLEGADRDRDLDAAEAFVRDVVETAAERDPETGEEVDVWSLAADGE